MHTEETKDRGTKAKSTDFGFAPMGQEMHEMMKKCCGGREGFPGCSAMMKDMMEAMKNQPCCTTGKEDIESDGRRKK